MTEFFYWLAMGIWIVSALLNFRDVRRRLRQERVALARLVEVTGLTPLQVQVALDEGEAAFFERLDQLTPTKEDT